MRPILSRQCNRNTDIQVGYTTTKLSRLCTQPPGSGLLTCYKLSWYQDVLLGWQNERVAFVCSGLLLNAIPRVFVTTSHFNNFSPAPSFYYSPALPSLPLLTSFWAFCIFCKTFLVCLLIVSAFSLLFLSTASPSLPHYTAAARHATIHCFSPASPKDSRPKDSRPKDSSSMLP